MVIDKNPSHWKFLIFYYNSDEPRAIVTKRTGLGWTVNFARPAVQATASLLIAAAITLAIANNLHPGH